MIRLAVRCRPELAEQVLADLLELVPGGVEEVGEVAGMYEYAVYGPPGELPAMPSLEAGVGEGLIEISSSEIPDDWADRWRDFHETISIGDGRLVVRPSWEPVDGVAQAPVDVVIDPGQAFGTGAHATTRLCLELLLDLADADQAHGALADLGTGSGVLAIAGAKLGWSPVSGYDSEIASVEAAVANAAANRVELAVERRNLREQAAPAVPTVVANLTAPLLAAVAQRLESPPAALVCSGLLASEIELVTEALEGAGLTVVEQRKLGDWAGLLARQGS